MAGHSHWARIKRAKSVADARRGRVWSKLARAIIVAARSGGGDPEANLSLRYAIDAARDANMPKDTIERAIKKGTGELAGGVLEELVFEGYGPGGAAVLCVALTDNRNRTAPEIKKIFELNGGKLATPGSVSRMFTKRGVFVISAQQADEDTLTSIALDTVRAALEAANIKPESAEVSMVAAVSVTLQGEDAERMMKLIDALEDHDDTQNVYTNFEVSGEDAVRLSGG